MNTEQPRTGVKRIFVLQKDVYNTIDVACKQQGSFKGNSNRKDQIRKRQLKFMEHITREEGLEI